MGQHIVDFHAWNFLSLTVINLKENYTNTLDIFDEIIQQVKYFLHLCKIVELTQIHVLHLYKSCD